jgi:hypothetical protein
VISAFGKSKTFSSLLTMLKSALEPDARPAPAR